MQTRSGDCKKTTALQLWMAIAHGERQPGVAPKKSAACWLITGRKNAWMKVFLKNDRGFNS